VTARTVPVPTPPIGESTGDDTIRLNDLRPQHAEIADEVAEGWATICRNTAFILGDQVRMFEAEFAAYHGRQHCIAVGSGADGLEFGLRAAGMRAGDEVVVPTNSYAASAFAVVRAGGRVRFADPDPDTGLCDGGRLADAARLGGGRSAVMPVHLYGQVCPLDDLADADPGPSFVIEDAAQAHGARRHGRLAGTMGQVAAFSFHASKNMGAYGDGGAVLTDDADIATRVRRLGNHGEDPKSVHVTVAGNSRLDEVQAVVLRAKLRRLDRWNQARREAAARYTSLLADVPEVRTPASVPGNTDVWHLYVVRVADRDAVAARLRDAGVMTGVHYPVPIHLSPAFRADPDLHVGAVALPHGTRRAGEILSLPMFPGITPEQQERVVRELTAAVRARPS
jgi:dTDP-4-amino-4,6-dideoxygalactose transaminase